MSDSMFSLDGRIEFSNKAFARCSVMVLPSFGSTLSPRASRSIASCVHHTRGRYTPARSQ